MSAISLQPSVSRSLHIKWLTLFSTLICFVLFFYSISANSNTILTGLFLATFGIATACVFFDNSRWMYALGTMFWAITPNPFSESISFSGLWLCSCLVLLLLTSQKEQRVELWKNNRWMLLLVLLIGALLANFTANDDVRRGFENLTTVEEIWRFVNMVLVLFLAPLLFRWALPDTNVRLNTMLITVLVGLGLTIIVMRFGIPIKTRIGLERKDWEAYTMSATGWVTAYKISDVLYSMYRTHHGYVFSIYTAFLSFLVAFDRVVWRRLVALIALIGVVSLLLWMGSRLGMIFAVISIMLVSMIFTRRVQDVWRVIMMSALLTMTIFLFAYAFPDTTDRIIEKRWKPLIEGTAMKQTSDRRNLFQAAGLEHVLENPLGVGWTSKMWYNGIFIAPHNDYLVFGMSYGLIGVIGYLFYIYRIIAQSINRMWLSEDIQERLLAGATFACIICLALNAMFDHLVARIHWYQMTWYLICLGTTPEFVTFLKKSPTLVSVRDTHALTPSSGKATSA